MATKKTSSHSKTEKKGILHQIKHAMHKVICPGCEECAKKKYYYSKKEKKAPKPKAKKKKR